MKNEENRLDLTGFNGLQDRLDDFRDPTTDKKINDKDSISFTLTCPDKLQSGDFTEILINQNPSISNTPNCIFESSDLEVVEVTTDGLIIAKKPGEATVTVTDAESGYSQSLDIEVVYSYDDEEEPFEEYWTINGEGHYLEDPTFEVSSAYTYVHDEASFNSSKENGGLKLYYEKYPSEDLWNTEANRAANFNDRHYVGTIDNEEVESNAQWVSETAQSVVIDGTTYYMAIFYHFDACNCELFNDAELTENSGKVLNISSIYYANCTNCWDGAVHAPGSTVPWIVPYFETNIDSKVIFRYEGKDDVYPWNDKVFGSNSWGVASIAGELGIAADFDVNKFQMVLEHQHVEHITKP